MMGRQETGREQLFYTFSMEDHVPNEHLPTGPDSCRLPEPDITIVVDHDRHPAEVANRVVSGKFFTTPIALAY